MPSPLIPGAGARHWVLLPAAIAMASRVFSVAVIEIEGVLLHGVPNLLSTWDGSWYLRIAAGGYHATPVAGGHYDYAFFPAWPMVIGLLSFGPFPPDLVAVVAANALFVIGAVLAWRVLEARLDAALATRATVLLAFAPPAYVFSMAYSEALFLTAVAASLLATRPVLKAGLAALASATRLAGLAVGAAALVAAALAPPHRRALAVVAVGSAVGFGAWFAYVALLTGDPMGYFAGSSSWLHGSGLHHLVTAVRAHKVEYVLKFGFVGLITIGGFLVVRRDKELGTYSLLVVAVALAALSSIPAGSIARYVLPAFPAYAGLGSRLGKAGTLALCLAFAIGQVVFAAWTIGPGRTPP